MNHVYRSVWNASTGTVTAVCEHAKSRGRKNASGKRAGVHLRAIVQSLSMAAALSCSGAGFASPTGGTVVAGNASIQNESGNTTIVQTTQNTALTWQSFDIGVTESVRFVQPSSNSVALNRMLGSDPTNILGSLSSNGKVFLVNPNGILFGTGAQVNVGSLVASTRGISDSDFMAGRYTFNGSGDGGIVNQGSIKADGGYVALLGASVSNQGLIAARLGSVALAAGNALTLDVAGDGLLNVTVNAGAVDALVTNGGLIQADGGQVLLTALSAGSLLQSAVNNTGVIQAQSIENRNGTIRLLGDMVNGTVSVAGTLDASAPVIGNGGFIDTSAAHVNVANDARITTVSAQGLTGSWLIDPVDYTIAASGGDITGAALSSNLASTNVTVMSSAGNSGTAGNVNVNDAVSWSANRLTLNAQNDININTAMSASDSASLALEYGQGAVAAGNTSTVNMNAPVNLPAGNNYSTLQGSDGAIVNYTVINSLGAAGSTTGTDLQGMNGNLARNYVLGGNIDASVSSAWNAGAGFTPIGTDPSRFTGIFDGLGHTVSGVYIDRTGSQFTGLFGYTAAGSVVRNLGLIGGSVASDSWGTGSLVGSLAGTLINAYATSNVYGFQTVGGLVGVIDGGAIIDSHATGDVVAGLNGEAGGLVGLIWGAPAGSVSNSYATGNVSSPVGSVGGLVGINWGTVSNSYATGTATGTDYIGGLIGNNSNGSFSNSYATGAVTGVNDVGGLAGSNSNSITDSYATGAVTGSVSTGGAVGSNYGTLSNSYATGNVYGGFVSGGLIGTNRGTVSYSHASGTVMGGDQTAGLVGGNQNGSISDSYASGDVTASTGAAGGLVGYSAAPISSSYATGAVTGVAQVGGLLGAMNGSTITNAYATGAVTGTTNVGGLVGNSSNGTITNTYSTGFVSGTTDVGGLLGSQTNATVTNGYWDTTTSGQASSVAGTGLTTGQMQAPSNFSGFNFTTTAGATGNNWVTVGFDGSLNGGAAATRPMLASEYSTTISNAHQLQLMSMDLDASYSIVAAINAAATGSANDVWSGSTFIPVGSQNTPFTGILAGHGHTISDLNIDLPAGDYVGLFGYAIDAEIRNVSLVDAQIIGGNYVGAFMGASVVGVASALAATGTVSGSNSVGGLIGYNNSMHLSESYAMTAVAGVDNVGGLMGETNGGVFSQFNYATGNVTATGNRAGGLVGYNGFAFLISDSYATGSVSGSNQVGGLVGYHDNASIISTSYSTGAVSGTSDVGGLVGAVGGGQITDSYWNVDTSGQATSAGGSAITSAQMLQTATFSGFDFTANWMGYDGHSNPLLRSLMTELTVTLGDAGRTYDALAYSGGNGVTYSIAPTGNLSGLLTFGGSSQGATDAGSYSITGSGLYSNQQGYIISYVAGELTIDKANLILAGSRSYDGTSVVAGSALTATGVAGQTFAVTGAGDSSNLASKNVQTGSALSSLTSLTLGSSSNGGLASNYTSLSADGSSVSITQAALTLSTSNVVKTYDGGTLAAGTATVTAGTLFGSDSISGGTFAFTDKDAGSGNKTVTTSGVVVMDDNSGGNYNVSYVSNTTSTIDRAQLTATITADDKVYDGTRTATATLSALTGLIGTETLSASNIATFNSKDVAAANLVTVDSTTLGDGSNGGLASNYTLASGQSATAHITPRLLTVVNQVAVDKVYDGTTVATVRGGSLANVVAGETVSLDEAGTFATPDAGTAVAITAANSLEGPAAANYMLTQPMGLAANITAAVATPPVPVMPPPGLTPTATVAYASAVGHAVSNSAIASLPVSAAVRVVANPVGPAEAYDVRGLNLTVIENSYAGMPAMSPPDLDEDDK